MEDILEGFVEKIGVEGKMVVDRVHLEFFSFLLFVLLDVVDEQLERRRPIFEELHDVTLQRADSLVKIGNPAADEFVVLGIGNHFMAIGSIHIMMPDLFTCFNQLMENVDIFMMVVVLIDQFIHSSSH
jgi:hypothetical protein